MFKAYNDTTCIILLLIISTSIPFANSMLRSQKPICSLTIECPNKSQVCIRSECVHLAATSNDVWIFAYGAIATFLLVKVIITSDVISRFQNNFFWQISWLIGCYYLCWWCPGSRRFAHPATIKVTDGSRAACKGARKWLTSWRQHVIPKGKTVQVAEKSEQQLSVECCCWIATQLDVREKVSSKEATTSKFTRTTTMASAIASTCHEVKVLLTLKDLLPIIKTVKHDQSSASSKPRQGEKRSYRSLT